MGRNVCHGGAHKTVKAHYKDALERGHEVVLLIHEIFGGWHEDAVDMLRRLADIRGDRLDAESEDKSWRDKSFSSYHKTRISVALHCAVAGSILTTVQGDFSELRNSEHPGRRSYL